MRSTDATWPAAGMLPVAEPLSSFTTSSAVAAKYATVEAARYFPSIPVRSASEQVLTATYAPVKGADDALTTVPVTKPSGDLACRKKYLPEDTMPRVADAGAPVKGLDVIREPACRASATSLSRWTPCTSKARATTTGRPASSPGTSGIESSADAASVLLLRSRSTALRNVKSAPTIPAAAAGSRLRTWTGAVRSSAPAGMVRMFPSLSRMRPPSAPMRTPDSATVGSGRPPRPGDQHDPHPDHAHRRRDRRVRARVRRHRARARRDDAGRIDRQRARAQDRGDAVRARRAQARPGGRRDAGLQRRSEEHTS